jgi:hypothetical protein
MTIQDRPPPRLNLDTIQDSVVRYKDAPYYQPIGPRRYRGAWWALVFMPLAMLGVQYGISYLLLKSSQNVELRAISATAPLLGLFTGSVFELLSLACLAIGVLIVYALTNSFSLTLAYVCVRWLLGYILSIVVTTATLASIGITIDGPTTPAHHSRPARTHAQLIPGSSLRSFHTLNSQGLTLQIDGRKLSLALPVALNVDGHQVTLPGGVTRLRCDRARGPALALPPKRYGVGADPVSWTLPKTRDALTGCSGTVMLATAGQAQQNGPEIEGFRLKPWKIHLG